MKRRLTLPARKSATSAPMLALLALLLAVAPALLGNVAGTLPGTGAGAAQTVPVAAREGRRNLAFNLLNHGDWSTQQPFIDLIRFARPWQGHLRGQWGGVSEQDLIDGGHLDSDGWALSVPGNVVKLATMILVDMPEEMTSLAGRYHVQWEGSAYLGFSGRARNVRYSGRNSATFEYSPGPGHVMLEFNRGDLRNLTVVHERHLERHEAGEIFNPDWLALIGDAENLRFVDWMHTNHSEISSWQERPLPAHFSWARGVPLEVMIALANETGAEPWFTLPHLADDDYMRRFAEMLRADLRDDLRAWVEFSNEVWNWSFAQANWAEEQGRARWGTENVWVQYYALRASEMVQIVDEVFADQPERLVRVLAVFTNWLDLEQDILDPPQLRAEDPEAPAPYTFFDVYAVTAYIGHELRHEENDPIMREWLDESLARAQAGADEQELEGAAREEYIAAHRFDHAIAQAAADIGDGSLTGRRETTLRDRLDRVLLHHAAVAATHDLALVMYEGGTHALARPDQHGDDEILAFYEALNFSEEMADLYRALIAGWAGLSEAPFNAYGDIGIPMRWGYWGHLRHLNDDNPRWRALMEATAP
ncbi:MAG: hypothetical protein JJT95_03010 [Pararhodobacter sp.]|nr:hypothetical protein [Pararhodobacter sp.]